MGSPYKVSDSTINELNSRSHEKIKQLFPDGPPCDIAKRINREVEALESSPSTYGLLIADEVIKELRHHRFSAFLDGDWECSYYAWLMNLIREDPFETALYYQSMGLRMKQIIRDGRITSPIKISVVPGWGKTACLELFRLRAQEWGFWLWECSEGCYKLISLGNRPDDIYATHAPIIQIVDSLWIA